MEDEIRTASQVDAGEQGAPDAALKPAPEPAPEPAAAPRLEPEAQAATSPAQEAAVRQMERTETDIQRQLAELRQEAARYRRSYREERQAREELARRIAELEAQLLALQEERQQVLVRASVDRAAARLGIVDPDAAYKLLDLAAVEYDEQGRPTNVEQLLERLVQERPYLRAQVVSPANPEQPRGSREIRREDLLDPRQPIDWAEVMRAVREGRLRLE
jgi:hypothetical protein